jgi:hypothetical protein
MTLSPRRPRSETRSRIDRAAVTLLRLVTDRRPWDPEWAARELRRELDDDNILFLLRARVVCAMLDRPSPTDDRALATVESALRGPRRCSPHSRAWEGPAPA